MAGRPAESGIGGAEAACGADAAQALIGAVAALGRGRGWPVPCWITAGDDCRGRAVCDRMAQRTGRLADGIRPGRGRAAAKGRPEGRPLTSITCGSWIGMDP